MHYFIIVCLLISISSKYVSPALFWPIAFFGLAFPILFIINILFIIYWLAQFKPVLIFGLVLFFLSLPTAYSYVQISYEKDKPKNKLLKVTSYNSMLFDLYNWTKNLESRAKIVTNLADINPDIICLQEFYTSEEKGDHNNIDTLIKTLKTNYYHVEYTTTLRGFDHWGVGTFSKYPIINQGKIMFNTTSNNLCIYSDIVVNRDTFRVYNVHLQSISFTKGDNKFYNDVVSETKEVEDEVSHGKHILSRLKRAFLKRAEQVETIALHMKLCKYKIILCGDFNDTSASYAYQKLSKNLKDAFVEKGNGFGRTYAGKWPQFRIDYILHDKALHCYTYKRSNETFTDHYPITAYFDNIDWN